MTKLFLENVQEKENQNLNSNASGLCYYQNTLDIL